MRYNEYTIPVEQVVDEAPMGLVKQGITHLASKIPGSIGAKARGSLETGGNANAMYKEFYNYLGKTGQKPTTASVGAFLKTKGVSDALIKQYVVASPGSVAKYPGGSGGQPAAGGGAAAPAKSGGFNVKLPQQAPAAAPKQGGFKTDLKNLPPKAPAAQAPAPEQPAAPSDGMTAGQRGALATGSAAMKTINSPAADPEANMTSAEKTAAAAKRARISESQKLQRLLSKISKRL